MVPVDWKSERNKHLLKKIKKTKGTGKMPESMIKEMV